MTVLLQEQLQNCCYEGRDIEIGQLGRPWLVCRVNADVFPGSLNSNTDIVIAMIVADAVKLTQSGLGDSQSVNRSTLFSLSQTNYHSIKSLLNLLLQSLASIPQIYQSIFQTNPPEIASHLVKPPPKCKTIYSEPCYVLRGEKCPDASRVFALKYHLRRDLNTDVSAFD